MAERPVREVRELVARVLALRCQESEHRSLRRRHPWTARVLRRGHGTMISLPFGLVRSGLRERDARLQEVALPHERRVGVSLRSLGGRRYVVREGCEGAPALFFPLLVPAHRTPLGSLPATRSVAAGRAAISEERHRFDTHIPRITHRAGLRKEF